MAGQSHLFAQWWKEYAFSDSRYLTSDAFTLCMETITAFVWGPMCYVIALFVAQEHPLRYPLQLIVSLGQIYGDLLYYATAMFDHYFRGVTYYRPESYYWWGYFFFLNFIWIVIPGGELWVT
jgi:cholestenol Delta-isomerase